MLKRCFLSFFAVASPAVCGAYTGNISLDKPDGFRRSGGTATCSVQFFKEVRIGEVPSEVK